MKSIKKRERRLTLSLTRWQNIFLGYRHLKTQQLITAVMKYNTFKDTITCLKRFTFKYLQMTGLFFHRIFNDGTDVSIPFNITT